jgi:hypothetical protein
MLALTVDKRDVVFLSEFVGLAQNKVNWWASSRTRVYFRFP